MRKKKEKNPTALSKHFGPGLRSPELEEKLYDWILQQTEAEMQY